LTLTGCAPALADETRFRADMIEQFRKAYPEIEFTPGTEALQLKTKGGDWDDGVINLHRIFLFCQNAPAEDCATVKTEFVGKIAQKPPALTAASLRVIVRDRGYIDYVEELEASSKERMAVRRQIGEDLFALLASDAANTISMVGDKGLSELGLSESDAWTQAWRQTQAILPAIPAPEKFRGQAMAFESDEYLASLTADLEAWKKVSEATGPDLMMTVVSDQFVFVGPMENGPKLAEFRKTVEEDCAAQQRCVSPNIYRFRDGRWVIAR
ncbi:MAG: hypothetical protein IBJ13_06975, partial [Sphingopyxis sp.]|nr:hypothetical protein [Sphingopyxis sp.]